MDALHIPGISQKIATPEQAAQTTRQWQSQQRRVVFTNGCFDLLHFGHLHYLSAARQLGDALIVGLNSADSVRRLKGPRRPINDELTRQHTLAALSFVDLVVLFDADTPYELIKTIKPDLLVKGGDWAPEQIVGADLVLAAGGQVQNLPFVEGYSTTNIEQVVVQRFLSEQPPIPPLLL
jgi:D-glycero-beta-D-manno-heptose 1-phosphate adenylyltransferase